MRTILKFILALSIVVWPISTWLGGAPCLAADPTHRWGPSLDAADFAAMPPSAQAESLVSVHLDGDGIEDLVVGYRLADGSGGLALMRGLGAAAFPRHPDFAAQSISDGPFELRRILRIATAADFLAAGDLDADGHADLVAASHDSETLHWWPAKGEFSFADARAVALGGLPTAMVAADVNRRDGLEDVVVAVSAEGASGESQAHLLIFQAVGGAMSASPERFELAKPASDLAAGFLDDDRYGDVAAAVGTTLHLIRGRDRKLSWPLEMRRDVGPAHEHVVELGVEARALGTGRFLGRSEQVDVAVLGASGELLVWESGGGDGGRLFDELGASYSPAGSPASAPVAGDDSPQRLIAAGFGVGPHLLAVGARVEGWQADGRKLFSSTAAELFVGEAPVAALAMRLDADAIEDLVLLREGSPVPEYLLSRGSTLPDFVVNSADDIDDGACDAVHCSLREAIQAANGDSGADVVGFAVGSGPVSIQVGSSLPPITETLTLDATSQPGYAGEPLVELVGTADSAGLFLDADALNDGVGNSLIRGFVINSFGLNGVIVEGQASRIEGNYIGTDATGLLNRGNASTGVRVQGAGSGNVIGGTSAAARNVISGNFSNGIWLRGSGNDNLVQGNYVGLGRDGTTPLGNASTGVGVAMHLAVVGGAEPGAGNVISGDANYAQVRGVATSSEGTGALIQGNLIGTDATGLVARGNIDGVGGTLFTAGGSAPGMANTVSGNLASGFNLFQNQVEIQGNRIGVGIDGTTPLGNGGTGARVAVSGSLVGGTSPGQGNIIAYSGGFAVDSNNFLGVSILGNSIHSNTGSPVIRNQIFTQRPVLTAAASNELQTRVLGSFSNSVAGEHRVEFFANAVCDTSGSGEGETFLGATTVMADADGAGSFSVLLPVSVPVGHVITATNTLPDGTTSRFSGCEPVTLLPPPGQPTLSVLQGIVAGPASFVEVPVDFQADGRSIATLAFELDIDESCLDFDATDGDGDGLPESVTLLGAAGLDVSVSYDAADTEGELEIAVVQLPPLVPLPDGTLLTLRMSTCAPAPGTSVIAAVDFTSTPSPSFGDVDGQSVPGGSSSGWVEVRSGERGDCNGDGVVDAGDLAACALEIFDGDGDFWLDVPGGSFAGNPVGCDANGDAVVDAGDVVCTELLLFGGTCADPAARAVGPRLVFPGPLEAGDRVRLEATFQGQEHDVRAAAFSLDLGPGLSFVADSLDILQPATARHLEVDPADTKGEIDLLLASSAGASSWSDGPLLAFELEWTGAGPTWVRFAESTRLSFGLSTGAGVAGPVEPGPVSIEPGLIFGDGFEVGDTSRWSSQSR